MSEREVSVLLDSPLTRGFPIVDSSYLNPFVPENSITIPSSRNTDIVLRDIAENEEINLTSSVVLDSSLPKSYTNFSVPMSDIISPEQITKKVEIPYLLPPEASRPLPIKVDPEVESQYNCLEDYKDPEKVEIKDAEGNLIEELLYFSGGTVRGKEGKAWSETWQIGLLRRKAGEEAYTLQPPVKLIGGNVKRECAATSWIDQEKQKICMLVHTDCFEPGDIEYFESDITDGNTFTLIDTALEPQEEIGQYDPQIGTLTRETKEGQVEGEASEKDIFMAYVRYDRKNHKNRNDIHFAKMTTNEDGKKSWNRLGVLFSQEDFVPYGHNAPDDPEYQWGIEAPYFWETTIDGEEFVEAIVVTFQSSMGRNGPRAWETRQRMTKVRIKRATFLDVIREKEAILEKELRGDVPVDHEKVVKFPFTLVGSVINPGPNAECGHGNEEVFQWRENGGTWQLREIIKTTNYFDAENRESNVSSVTAQPLLDVV